MSLGENGALVSRPCSCMSLRDARRAMERSGIPASTLDRYTFDLWETPNDWQKRVLSLGREYADKCKTDKEFDRWFILSGRPGCGKTHLCTAVFRAIVEGGTKGMYLSWRDFSRQAKASANDNEAFHRLISAPKKVPLLYIDDFWKGGVSPADVRLAFELLNDRYAAGRKTILSSEHTLEAVIRGDEAIGSRLFERSKGFYTDLSNAVNWRLRGGA